MKPIDFSIPPDLLKLIEAIKEAGGKPLLVGGCVRDFCLHITPKDFDVEVYGLSLEVLEGVLKNLGSVHAVGKSFGVLKLTLKDLEIDVSLPRTENKQGQGHRGFLVTPDPALTFEKASLRRDFTINAMGYDPTTQVLLDPHQGQADLNGKILRHVSEAFLEDPLRVLRACQLVARFGLTLDLHTVSLCQSMQNELPTLPRERIWEEFKKLLFAQTPSLGLKALKETKALSLFGDLEALVDCPQDPLWHPEGDVWIHTLMVVDQAAKMVRQENLNPEESLIILLGALCHDLGKPKTTEEEKGRIRSKGHEEAGTKPTQNLLRQMGAPETLIEAVLPLVAHHLKPAQLYKNRDTLTPGAVRRLAAKVSIERLCKVAKSDFLGRTTKDALLGHDPSTEWLLQEAKKLSVQHKAPAPILLGRHLMALGMPPGSHFKSILQSAYEAQLEGEFEDEPSAKEWLDGYLRGKHP